MPASSTISKNKTRGEVDKEAAACRDKCETDWMVELRTVYPYGFNDRCKGRDWRERGDSDYVGGTLFKKLGHFIPTKSRAKKVSRPQVTPETSLQLIHESCGCHGQNQLSCACVLNFARVLINSLKKSHAKKLGSLISDIIYKGEGNNNFLPQYYEAILDMIDSKFIKGFSEQSASKQKPKVIFPVFFRCKLIQDLGLSRMFRETSLLEALPNNTLNKIPTIVFKLGKTIRGKIFSYRQALENLDVDDFIASFDHIDCQCQNSKFVDPHHKHIITGDLSIIEHSELKKLLQLGPNFREQPKIQSPKIIFKGIKKDFEIGIFNWAKAEGVPVEAFGEWKTKCLAIIKERLNKIFYQKNNNQNGGILNRRDVVEYLDSFHSKYVITAIDKTSSNVGVVCKKFYIKNILEECGLWPGAQNST